MILKKSGKSFYYECDKCKFTTGQNDEWIAHLDKNDCRLNEKEAKEIADISKKEKSKQQTLVFE